MPDSSPNPHSTESIAAVGGVVAGRYRLTRLIGEGGMGAVYEAEHVEIGKRVAIKLVRGIHARHTEIAARFKREARSASAIESDHIVQVFDAGNDPELGLFMAMELLRGEDLGSLLSRTGRLDAETACGVVLQAASALDKAHSAGIVHRDLKPANIFLVQREDQSAMVKLVDFGIAKIVRDESTSGGGGLTRTGSAIGTPNYMSPEQAQGLLTLDHRTDIYSLGAVLYEMIVGTPPFPEMPTYEQTILQILTKPVPRASASVKNVPPAVDQLIADMMVGDPGLRVAKMRDIRDRIVALYPGLEKTRLLLTAPGTTATGLSALRVSGRPASDAVVAGMRAQTNVAVTYDASAGTMLRSMPAGVPRKSPTKWLVIGGAGALLVTIAAVALVRSAMTSSPPAATAVGLVTSVSPLPASPVPVAPVDTLPVAPAASALLAEPALSAATGQKAAPGAGLSNRPGSGALAAPRGPGKSTPAAAAAKEKPTHPGGQVGGVGISNEF